MRPVIRPLTGNAALPHPLPKILPDYSVVPPVARFQTLDWSNRAILDASKVTVELQTTGGVFVAAFVFVAGYWELYGVPDGTYRVVISGAGYQTRTLAGFAVSAASPNQAAQEVQQILRQGFSVYAYPSFGGTSVVLSSVTLEHPHGGVVANGSVGGFNTASFAPVPGGTYIIRAYAANGYEPYSGQFAISSDYQAATIHMMPSAGASHSFQ